MTRLRRSEGSQELQPELQPGSVHGALQRGLVIIPSQLDRVRKKERLRELYGKTPRADNLDHLAAALGPLVGLDRQAATELSGYREAYAGT
jgi:hypothetical protein